MAVGFVLTRPAERTAVGSFDRPEVGMFRNSDAAADWLRLVRRIGSALPQRGNGVRRLRLVMDGFVLPACFSECEAAVAGHRGRRVTRLRCKAAISAGDYKGSG